MPRRMWRRVGLLQHEGAGGRRAIELLTRPLRHRDLRVLGGSMAGARINLGGSFLRYLTGDAEPEVQRALEEHIKPGHVVYDVGANVGFFTILCARLVGPRGKVYAFEPMPPNAKALRHNVALNGLDNVVVVEKALSSESGTAQMFVSAWSAFHSLNVEGASKNDNLGPQAREPITVQTITLDEFVEADPARAPDLIKLDVEGAELVALEGMRGTLRSAEPLLLCELHGTRGGFREFVDSMDYLARIVDSESPRYNPVNAHTLAWSRRRALVGSGEPV
jgi:FkbM family methyltransferase